MRVLICGGRDYPHRQRVFDELDALHQQFGFTHVINGGARGADKFAREWARDRGVSVRVFTANWARHGVLAGPLRNERMMFEGRPELVVAFPGGAGTADAVTRATKYGIAVRRIDGPLVREWRWSR